MCMANLMAAPGNMVGSLWGDDNLGENSLGYKLGKSFDKTMAGPSIKTPTVQGPQQVQKVSAQQRRSIIK